MSERLVRSRFAVPVDADAVAAAWRRRGYSCAPFVDPPGRTWEGFVHGVDELVTVVEGRLEIVVEGERLIAAPGDEVFIPRGAVHSVRNVHPGATRWLYGYN